MIKRFLVLLLFLTFVGAGPVAVLAAAGSLESSRGNKELKPRSVSLKVRSKTLKSGELELYFAWTEKVAAAVFFHFDSLWVVFDKSKMANLDEVLKDRTIIANAEQLTDKNSTILKFRINESKSAKVVKRGQAWIITIPPKTKKFYNSLKKEIIQYNTPFSKGIFFPLDNMPESVRNFVEPETGTYFSVLPLYDPGYGIAGSRKFVDFNLLETIQGFAVNVFSDETEVEKIRPGIEINIPRSRYKKSEKRGFQEFVDNEDDEDEEAGSGNETSSIVSFKKFKASSFTKHLGLINQELAKASKSQKSANYLVLAKFYFFHGMYHEAAAALDMVKSDVYAKYMSKETLLLNTLGEYMKGHYRDAKKAIDKIEVKKLTEQEATEVKFWQRLLIVQIAKVGDQINYVEFSDKFLKKYPKDIKHKAAMLDIDYSLLHRKDNSKIRNLVKIVNQETENPYIKNSMSYYLGVIARRDRDPDNAIKIWKRLAKDDNDIRNSTRAKYSATELLLDLKIIDDKEAIKRLERLRLSWRGGDIEARVLRKLGELYADSKNYVEALRVWKQYVNYFTGSGDTLFMTARMSEVFIDLFMKEESKNGLTDLKALALYYEFRELTPIGAVGDKIIQQLAERMVKLDLLERAASLYAHQVDYRLRGEARVKTGMRLARIYIDDRKSQEALDLLDKLEQGKLSVDDKMAISKIRARAVAEQGRFDEALKIIRNDFSDESNALKARIFLERKDWENLKAVLTVKLYVKAEDAKKLTPDDNIDLLRLAIANYMLSDKPALERLARDFKGIVSDMKTINLINFLAEGKDDIDFRDLERTAEVGTIETFFASYRKSLQAPELW
jgi:tetratricopeptide (TPR) repeat protein